MFLPSGSNILKSPCVSAQTRENEFSPIPTKLSSKEKKHIICKDFSSEYYVFLKWKKLPKGLDIFITPIDFTVFSDYWETQALSVALQKKKKSLTVFV